VILTVGFEIEQIRITACYWNGVYVQVVGGGVGIWKEEKIRQLYKNVLPASPGCYGVDLLLPATQASTVLAAQYLLYR
jgi:hypothetical protein